jgi:hypothetical protein
MDNTDSRMGDVSGDHLSSRQMNFRRRNVHQRPAYKMRKAVDQEIATNGRWAHRTLLVLLTLATLFMCGYSFKNVYTALDRACHREVNDAFASTKTEKEAMDLLARNGRAQQVCGDYKLKKYQETFKDDAPRR